MIRRKIKSLFAHYRGYEQVIYSCLTGDEEENVMWKAKSIERSTGVHRCRDLDKSKTQKGGDGV